MSGTAASGALVKPGSLRLSRTASLQDECLNPHWFRSLRHAREEIGRLN